jgi:organic radical activating enzyme
MIDEYTSSWKKFLKHPNQLANYATCRPGTIISSHISPTAMCNMKCEYCSFMGREKNKSISLKVLGDYIHDVHSMGCKAIVLTGGGEPMMYPDIIPLIKTILNYRMQIGIITNGYNLHDVITYPYAWIRISINNNEQFFSEIIKTKDSIGFGGTKGFSLILSENNKKIANTYVEKLLNKYNAAYVRLLPDCFQDAEEFEESYDDIYKWLGPKYIKDKRFMVQKKIKKAPDSTICHQSFFRPFLSEYDGGTIFPCDSVTHMSSLRRFEEKYALCKARDIKELMNYHIFQQFNPSKDCTQCTFSGTVNAINDVVLTGMIQKTDERFDHENFV